VLVPIDAELSVPDLRWLVGSLLLTLYLLVCWLRTRRALNQANPRPAPQR